MADKNYYRRQARTLRKFALATPNETLSERLLSMAGDFESKADSADQQPSGQALFTKAGADGDEGHG